MKFITLMQEMYNNAFSSVQIKGYVAGPFPMQCSVRQDCPTSMLLFAVVLNPLIHTLERRLTGSKIVQLTTKTAVVAYANNFTTFVTAPADIQIIVDLSLTYKMATGARLNIRKSKAMAAGSRAHR